MGYTLSKQGVVTDGILAVPLNTNHRVARVLHRVVGVLHRVTELL